MHLIEQTITNHHSLCVVLDLDETIAIQHKVLKADPVRSSRAHLMRGMQSKPTAFRTTWEQDTDVVYSSRVGKPNKGQRVMNGILQAHEFHMVTPNGVPQFWLQKRPYWSYLKAMLHNTNARVYLYTMAVEVSRDNSWRSLNAPDTGPPLGLARSVTGNRAQKPGKRLRDLVREPPFHSPDEETAQIALNSGIRPFVVILDDVQARERPKNHPQTVWHLEDEKQLLTVAPMNPTETSRDVELKNITDHIKAGRQDFINGLVARAKELQRMGTYTVAQTLVECVKTRVRCSLCWLFQCLLAGVAICPKDTARIPPLFVGFKEGYILMASPFQVDQSIDSLN